MVQAIKAALRRIFRSDRRFKAELLSLRKVVNMSYLGVYAELISSTVS